MLAGMDKPVNQHDKVAGNTMLPASLESVGVSKMQSSRWQKEAKVNEDVFD